jgi:hypothetical protein
MTSAYQYVNGPFDYNKMPLAPLGCKVQMHESANRRKTWDPRALHGWYLGTSPEHYRCHIIFCQKTRSECISDTVFFQHKYITQPIVTPEDQIVKAIGDLTSTLKQRKNTKGDAEIEGLQRLRDIFNNATPQEVEKKRVTFKDPIPEPRVGKIIGDMQLSPKTAAPTPRVIAKAAPTPRVIAKAVVDKPQLTNAGSQPTIRSKYVQAIADIVKRRSNRVRQPSSKMIELAQAILDDNPSSAAEYAGEVFDDESGNLLKY